jgi:hypothetical protein
MKKVELTRDKKLADVNWVRFRKLNTRFMKKDNKIDETIP